MPCRRRNRINPARVHRVPFKAHDLEPRHQRVARVVDFKNAPSYSSPRAVTMARDCPSDTGILEDQIEASHEALRLFKSKEPRYHKNTVPDTDSHSRLGRCSLDAHSRKSVVSANLITRSLDSSAHRIRTLESRIDLLRKSVSRAGSREGEACFAPTGQAFVGVGL